MCLFTITLGYVMAKKIGFWPIWDKRRKNETNEQRLKRYYKQLSLLLPGWEHYNEAQKEFLLIGFREINESRDKNMIANWLKLAKIFFPQSFSDKPVVFTPMQYAEYFEKILGDREKERYIHTPSKMENKGEEDDR